MGIFKRFIKKTGFYKLRRRHFRAARDLGTHVPLVRRDSVDLSGSYLNQENAMRAWYKKHGIALKQKRDAAVDLPAWQKWAKASTTVLVAGLDSIWLSFGFERLSAIDRVRILGHEGCHVLQDRDAPRKRFRGHKVSAFYFRYAFSKWRWGYEINSRAWEVRFLVKQGETVEAKKLFDPRSVDRWIEYYCLGRISDIKARSTGVLEEFYRKALAER